MHAAHPMLDPTDRMADWHEPVSLELVLEGQIKVAQEPATVTVQQQRAKAMIF